MLGFRASLSIDREPVIVALINLKWLLALAAAAGFTTFFSLFNNPGIRGWRNLGFLACFVIGIAMAAMIPLISALVTWGVAVIFSGLAYYAFELIVFLKHRSNADAERPSITTIIHGLFLWPIMLPEVIEYSLAEIGILQAPEIVPNQPVEEHCAPADPSDAHGPAAEN